MRRTHLFLHRHARPHPHESRSLGPLLQHGDNSGLKFVGDGAGSLDDDRRAWPWRSALQGCESVAARYSRPLVLKAVNRLGYFPVLNEVPAEVVGHVRRDLGLPEGTMPICAATRTAERHRNLVRASGEFVHDTAVPGRSPLVRLTQLLDRGRLSPPNRHRAQLSTPGPSCRPSASLRRA